MKPAVRRLAAALLIVVVALASGALAGDADEVRRAIRAAQSVISRAADWDGARRHLQRAREQLEGLEASVRAPLEAEIAALEQEVTVKERDRAVHSLKGRVRRIFSSGESMHERSPTELASVVAHVDEKLAEAMASDDGKLAPEEVRLELEAQRAAFVEGCRVRLVEHHFDQAERRLTRIQNSAAHLNEGSLAEWIRDFDEHLSAENVPRTDPRVDQLEQRLEAFLKAHQASTEQAATQEKIRVAVDEWTSRKNAFERDCPAWSAELPSERARWVQTASLGVDKAARRQETAQAFMGEARYKDVVQWFGADPAVVALKAEVEGWRREGAAAVCAAADVLLAQAEQHAGEPEQAGALQQLISTVEARGEGAPGQQATLARARALAAGGGAAGEVGGDAPPAAPAGGGSILGLLLGCVCCFGLLGGGGAVGFLAYKQLKPTPPAPGA